MTLYGSYCPIAKASEILGEKWTILILRELLMGTCRFSDFQRAIARISPTMLTKRLKELEDYGLVMCKRSSGSRSGQYYLTAAGKALYPVITEIASWGMKWVHENMSEDELDINLLMWDMRRRIKTELLPDCDIVIQFTFDNEKSRESWWVLIDANGEIDVCDEDTGKDVDLYITTDARTMIEIWEGDVSISSAKRRGRLKVVGEWRLARTFPKWIGLSMFSHIRPATSAERAALEKDGFPES